MSANNSPALVFSSAPSDEVAQDLARALVGEGLAACVTSLPGATSTYRWKGQLETSQEVQLLIKSTADRLPRLEKRLCALHPYEVPEFITLDISGGLPEYLRWLGDAVHPCPGSGPGDTSQGRQ